MPTNENDKIIERIKGVAGQRVSKLEAMSDPTNPNVFEANDNARDQSPLRARIAELEAAMYRVHAKLSTMSMGTEGCMRKRICTVANILGKPLGKGRSSHGDIDEENSDN